jgi:hypothetical protein
LVGVLILAIIGGSPLESVVVWNNHYVFSSFVALAIPVSFTAAESVQERLFKRSPLLMHISLVD